MTYRDILTERIREPWTQAEALKIADGIAFRSVHHVDDLIDYFADVGGAASLRTILADLICGNADLARTALLRVIENIAISRWPQERTEEADREYAAEQANRGRHDRQDFEARR